MTPQHTIRERFYWPRWAGGGSIEWATAFAGLFLLITFCRSLLMTIIPIDALRYLGSAAQVSGLFFAISAVSVVTALCVPTLIQWMRTRRLFYAGVMAAFTGPLFLALPGFSYFLLGMALWMVSTLIMEITASLYVMHHISRRELSLFEPRRVLFMVISYSIGPWLGVYLKAEVWQWSPYLLTMFMALLTIGYFRFLGLSDAGARHRLAKAPNPLKHLRRFFTQPRLRLGWGISLARSAWWTSFFIYVPIYAVTSGLGEVVGGMLISAGVATVFSVTLWGRIGRRYGFRKLLITGFSLVGGMSMVVTASADTPKLCAALLLITALCAAIIDGAGNMPFMRAVRPLEREEMMGVFSTYRDMASLLPAGLFAMILRVLPLQAVFAVSGVWMLVLAWYCRHLPRRL